MVAQLTATSFVAGPKDELATLDVYKKNDGSVVNSIQDIATKYDVNLASGLRGGIGTLPIIKGVSANGTLDVDKASLLDRIVSASKTVSNSVGGVLRQASSVKNLVTRGISEAQNVYVTVGGFASRISSAKITDINSLGSLMNGLTGDMNRMGVRDNGALAGLYSGVITEASSLGITGAFVSLKDTIGDSAMVREVVSYSLPSVIASSDVQTLGDMAGAVSAGTINMLNPDTIRQFSSTYVAPVGATTRDMQSTYSQVMGTYSSIDSGWNSKTRNTSSGLDSILDLTKITNLSRDMSQVVNVGARASTNTQDKLYSIGSLFKGADVNKEIQTQFPQSAVGRNFQAQRGVIDPRLLAAGFQ